MAPPDNHTWGAHNVQPGAPLSNVDENAKIFQKFLNETVPMPQQKVNKKCAAHPQVEGGLPPHLLHEPKDKHRSDHLDTPRATMSGSRSYGRVSDRQTSESAWSSRPVAGREVTPAASVNLSQREDDSRAQHWMIRGRKFATTSAAYGPVQQSNSSMHPGLQAALAEQVRIRKVPTPVANPNDAWVEVYRNGRGNRPMKSLPHEIKQSSHPAPESHREKWRPEHSSCWNSQSLPTSDASVKFDSDDTNLSFRSYQSNGGAPLRDARGSIADELDIVPKADGTGWVNKNYWKQQDYGLGSDDESSQDSFEKRWHWSYCRDWVQELPERPPPLVAIPRDDAETHWECDINTKDGTFMSPVEYPPTTVNSQDPGTREELVRRLTSTAEITITMEGEKLRKRVKKREQREAARGEIPGGPGWRRVTPSTPVDRPNAPDRSPHRFGQPPVQATTARFENRHVDPREPRIPCFLRPVKRDDLPQVLDIYNWEVEHGRQALDAQPLTLRDIQRLSAECDAADTPFIVAVEESSPVESTFRGNESALVSFRGTNQKNGRSPPSGKILGFGLITLPPAGLSGKVHTSVSRFNGKVHVYVESKSRRLGVGRCILHKLLRCCSKRAQYGRWYDWHDPSDSKACADAGYNIRNYSRVFVEVASFKGDPDFNWRKKLLQEMNFLYVNTTDQTRKVINGGWFDNTVWQHDCD